jgi:hypothetical protein
MGLEKRISPILNVSKEHQLKKCHMGFEKMNIAKFKLSIFYHEVHHTILKIVLITLQKFLSMTCKPTPNYLILAI